MSNNLWHITSSLPEVNFEQQLQIATNHKLSGVELVIPRPDAQKTLQGFPFDVSDFSSAQALQFISLLNKKGLNISLSSYHYNMGRDEAKATKNRDHLLDLIRMAYYLGGDENNVSVSTFVGYNHAWDADEFGFDKNIEEYKKVFSPIVKYAEDLGVTLLYENCPMEGWSKPGQAQLYNNLPATLAARKIMYEVINSPAHGEVYDPSHDIWQYNNPLDVIELSEIKKIKRIHCKATTLKKDKKHTLWGGVFSRYGVNSAFADEEFGAADRWDRFNYTQHLPTEKAPGEMNWTSFFNLLQRKGFNGDVVLESPPETDLQMFNLNMQESIQFISPKMSLLTGIKKPKERLIDFKKKSISNISHSKLLL